MNKKECPFCGELIQSGALKCRYCREWLNNEDRLTEVTIRSEDAQPSETRVGQEKNLLEEIESTLVSDPLLQSKEEVPSMLQVEEKTEMSDDILDKDVLSGIILEENFVDQPSIITDKQPIVERSVTKEKVTVANEDDDLLSLKEKTVSEDADELAIVDELLDETIEILTFEEKVNKPEPQEIEKETLVKENTPPETVTLTDVPDTSAVQFVSIDKELKSDTKQAMELNEPVKESIITSPISYSPISSNIGYQNEKEEEDKDHLIRWQDFKINKILALISFGLTLLSSYYLYKEYTNDLTIVSVTLLALSFGLNTFLTFQMSNYVRNFDSYEELKRPMQFLVGSYALTTLGIILFFILYHFYMVIMLIIPIVCILSIAILRIIVGWKLWKNTYDHVGGLEGYGSITFFSVFLPGLGIVTPLVLFKVFSDAQSHIDEYGYLDDNPNDY